jgi:hypothetical protein
MSMVETTSRDLVPDIPKAQALTVFTSEGAIDPILKRIREEIDAFTPNVTTDKGRKAIASIAYKVSQSKSYLESVGKKLADEQKEIPRKIDATRKQIRDTLDKWRDEVRAPLTEWEMAEERRIGRHKAKLSWLDSIAPGRDAASSELRQLLADVEAVDLSKEACEEFLADYATSKEVARVRLTDTIAVAEKREAEAAELARLRKEAAEREAKEREERIAREAAERARAEAERKAQEEIERREAAARAEREEAERREREAAMKAEQERLDAERRELELRRQAEESERRAAEAEARAKRELEERQQREKEEAERRERNRAHRAKVNAAAAATLVAGGLQEDAAKLAVTLIAKGAVPSVTISY